eukprot:scaffold145581_cov99-Phaeocystis_antarctica.AAC.1
MVPWVGRVTPVRALSIVVLPLPDGPMQAMHSAGPKMPDTSSRIRLTGGALLNGPCGGVTSMLTFSKTSCTG